jgi:hypothetical protein
MVGGQQFPFNASQAYSFYDNFFRSVRKIYSTPTFLFRVEVFSTKIVEPQQMQLLTHPHNPYLLKRKDESVVELLIYCFHLFMLQIV